MGGLIQIPSASCLKAKEWCAVDDKVMSYSGRGSDETVVELDFETQRGPSQSRKESVLNCLLIETRGHTK